MVPKLALGLRLTCAVDPANPAKLFAVDCHRSKDPKAGIGEHCTARPPPPRPGLWLEQFPPTVSPCRMRSWRLALTAASSTTRPHRVGRGGRRLAITSRAPSWTLSAALAARLDQKTRASASEG